MKKYKECKGCQNSVTTQAIVAYAKIRSIPVSQIVSIYCMKDRNYHRKTDVCDSFIEKAESLVE